MAASAAFYSQDAEVVCHLWNCGATSALHVHRHCSCKNDSADLLMLQDVPTVN